MQAKLCSVSPTRLLSPPMGPPPSNTAAVVTISTRNLTRRPIEDSDLVAVASSDYQSLFTSQRTETSAPVTLKAVDGAIPPDFPSGTYYLAGPGIFSDDHGSTVSPLDGHGYLRAFSVDGGAGEVRFLARYVRTAAMAEERHPVTGRWRFTHRGPFSVLKGGRKVGNVKVMKDVANTSVVKWGGRLLCMWEGGLPHEVESGTLDTVGRFDVINGCDAMEEVGRNGDVWDMAAAMLRPLLHGVFNMPPRRLLSHYKVDAKRNRLLMVSCNAEDMLLPRNGFTFYEFDSNFKLLQRQEFSIHDHLMVHDWAFTDSHYILFGNRVKLDIPGALTAMCGFSPMISALSVNSSKNSSPIYLLPRFRDGRMKEKNWRVPVEAPSQLWMLHFGNAFEKWNDNGSVQIQMHFSACSYQWFNFEKMFGYNWRTDKLDPSIMNAKVGQTNFPLLVQVNIELDADGNCENCHVTPLNHHGRTADFPVINPNFSGSRHTYVYAATSSGSHPILPNFPFDTIIKLNVENNSSRTWSTRSRRFIGEPIFVPIGPQEDDGYLLMAEYAVSVQRCYLVVLNPKRIGESNALVARIEVPRNLTFPMGFHGFWAGDEGSHYLSG